MKSDHPSYGHAPEPDNAQPQPVHKRRTRRDALRLFGAAAAGGAATSVVATGHAAADNGISLAGNVTSTNNLTRVDFTGSATGAAFLFQAGNAYPGAISGAPAALAGWSTIDHVPHGVHGFTDRPHGSGVVAVNDSPSAEATAIRAVTPGGTGGRFQGGLNGADVISAGVGLRAQGDVASVYMVPVGAPPPAKVGAVQNGMLTVDANGSLWFCVAGGFPGRWQKVADVDTAGAYHPLPEPYRAYDSRRAAPEPGALAKGQARVVIVKDARSTTTGAVVEPDVLPEGTRAVTLNVTITSTTGTNGYLTLNPGTNATIGTSAINWSGPGQTVANGLTMAIGSFRQLSAVCGGAGSGGTHFLIDITGYYR